MTIKELKKKFGECCNEYLLKFCKKHGFDPDDAYWVADDPGTIVSIGDYCFDFQDIKHDIDNNVPKGKMIEYYDYSYEKYVTTGNSGVNYRSFILGMR